MFEGYIFQITCVAQSDPHPTITWLKDGSALTDPSISVSYPTPMMSLLIIAQSQREHAGEYTCVASNPAGQVTKSSRLKVKGFCLLWFVCLALLLTVYWLLYLTDFHQLMFSFVLIYWTMSMWCASYFHTYRSSLFFYFIIQFVFCFSKFFCNLNSSFTVYIVNTDTQQSFCQYYQDFLLLHCFFIMTL